MIKIFKIFFILLTVSLIHIYIFACFQKKNPLDSDVNIQGSIFSNLNVGKISYYVKFEGEDYHDPNNINFHYIKDTLRVEIINKDERGFLIDAKYTDGSTIFEKIKNGELDSSRYLPLTSCNFYADIKDDSLMIICLPDTEYVNSILLGRIYSASPYKLSLKPIEKNKVEIRGWKTSFPYCECYNEGYTVNFRLLDNFYTRLNVIVDDKPMSRDGNGETIIYSKEAGIVRHYYTSWWINNGFGWDLLISQ
jgi:hypothetical protein